MRVYRSREQIKNQVLHNYHNDDTELNRLHFDFEVEAKERDLLEIYQFLQSLINGDVVCRLNDISKTGNVYTGTEVSYINDGEYENNYKGNYMNFLNTFNGSEESLGFVRFTEIQTSKNHKVFGEAVDFIC